MWLVGSRLRIIEARYREPVGVDISEINHGIVERSRGAAPEQTVASGVAG